jgi:hypothetical protein
MNAAPATTALLSSTAAAVQSVLHLASVGTQSNVQSRNVAQTGNSSHFVASAGHASAPQL